MAIRDVVLLGFGANGSIPQVVTLGFFSAPSSTALVGIWQNVTYLEARQPTTELSAASDRLTLQARADNANN